MAVTHGHGNPPWARDEILLALDLYLRCNNDLPSAHDRRVIALSTELRRLSIHKDATKRENFRNPASVAFKLQNIRQVATGKGFSNASREDRAVWLDFGTKPEMLATVVALIRGQSATDESNIPDSVYEMQNVEDEFVEGRVLTVLHRTRERSPKLRSLLLRSRKEKGGLVCDACGDAPKILMKSLEDAGFEVHHMAPLATTGECKTRLADLALLCAVCHRLIHRAIKSEKRWVSVDELRLMLSSSKPLS